MSQQDKRSRRRRPSDERNDVQKKEKIIPIEKIHLTDIAEGER